MRDLYLPLLVCLIVLTVSAVGVARGGGRVGVSWLALVNAAASALLVYLILGGLPA